jgi:hypothetical protein
MHRPQKVIRVLFMVSVLVALAAATGPGFGASCPLSATTGLVFEFSRPVSDNFWETVVSTMGHADLSTLFGHPVVLVERKRVAEGDEYLDLVQVTLRGDCAGGLNYESSGDGGALGWVHLLDGRIQRFVFVDCDQIARMLRSELRDKAAGERLRVMARAISYVVVHELVHITTQDPSHRETGLRKAYATKGDLLSGAGDISKQGTLVAPNSASCPADETTQASRLEPDFW